MFLTTQTSLKSPKTDTKFSTKDFNFNKADEVLAQAKQKVNFMKGERIKKERMMQNILGNTYFSSSNERLIQTRFLLTIIKNSGNKRRCGDNKKERNYAYGARLLSR